jgi:hypothetical protein
MWPAGRVFFQGWSTRFISGPVFFFFTKITYQRKLTGAQVAKISTGKCLSFVGLCNWCSGFWREPFHGVKSSLRRNFETAKK